MSHFGAVRYFELDRKWVITVRSLRGSIINQRKNEQNRAMHSRVIIDSTHLPAPFCTLAKS